MSYDTEIGVVIMIVPQFINPFCTATRYVPDTTVQRETTIIEVGGCLTDEDERLFYSKEEWERRKGAGI